MGEVTRVPAAAAVVSPVAALKLNPLPYSVQAVVLSQVHGAATVQATFPWYPVVAVPVVTDAAATTYGDMLKPAVGLPVASVLQSRFGSADCDAGKLKS